MSRREFKYLVAMHHGHAIYGVIVAPISRRSPLLLEARFIRRLDDRGVYTQQLWKASSFRVSSRFEAS